MSENLQRPGEFSWSFGDRAGVPPFPSSWVEIEVMDAFPESGLFMGSNIFTAAGPPAGGVRQESGLTANGVSLTLGASNRAETQSWNPE